AAGLSGVLVTPGADLLYLAGDSPISITERITMLAIHASRPPATIVPAPGARARSVPPLERRGAEPAPVALRDWADGDDAYAAAAELLDPDGAYAISDSAWAMHVLGLQRALPGSRYVSMTDALPTLRAVKDAEELERMAAAGAAADSAFAEIATRRFSG